MLKTLKLLKQSKIWLFVLPSFLGMLIFYFIPAIASLFYAFTDVRGDFVWFRNFVDIFTNSVFRLAAGNSLRFLLASVPLNIMLSFLLACALQKLRYKKALVIAFMLPLIIPSGSVVFFWNTLFADNGAINSILFRAGMDTVPWFHTGWAFAIALCVFLFRNIGFNLVLYLSGLQLISPDYYEVAKIEGAGYFTTFRHVTLIYIMPTTFLVFMMSIINSFRVFRELYLLFGQHPNQSVYMLQHFMNSQFINVNMQRLSVSSIALSAAVIIMVLGVFSGQRKLSEHLG